MATFLAIFKPKIELRMFIFVYVSTQTDPARTGQRSAFCRSRRELSNAYLLPKFGFDTAENEPFKVFVKFELDSSYIRVRYKLDTS